MSKLIILSNRVSIPDHHKPAAGGLAVALQDALNDVGGIWLGWNGEKVGNADQSHFSRIEKANIEYFTCPLTHTQYKQYYTGFANNSLWPAMHHRADLIEFESLDYQGYQQVNFLFAQKLAKIAEPDDIIWVHDYHFFSVARYCRELGMQNKIGFFLHIPFAPLSMWQNIPVATQLIQDLCQYDVIGLQTEKDQKQCINVCTTLLKAQKIQQCLISFHQRISIIKCYPIGVNPTAIEQIVQAPNVNMPIAQVSGGIEKQKTIIGVDRIDYSKGLLERFICFAEFLEQNPEYQSQVKHIQVACPCRLDVAAYKRLYERLRIKIELINQEFQKDKWIPIECSYDVTKHSDLMQLYRHSDICWISSIRDGMNLVAKEFIAAQDAHNPGVLILSKYAGAAESMTDALIVDPTDRQAMIDTLKVALNMPLSERVRRYKQLIKGLKDFDINDWRNSFLNDLKYKDPLQDFKYTDSKNVNSLYHIL